MANASRPSSRTLVGLDIEPGYVTAVEARDGAHIEVQRAATVSLEPGVVRDGEVADVEALAAVLRDFFRDNNLPKRVRMGVANQRIVVRTVDLPPISDPKELAAAVQFQAQEHIPMPLEQAVLEHQSLGIVETPEGPRARVVLVAARRDMIERLLGAARQAGLRPEGIDLSAFAMIRALHREGSAGQAVLYVNVGGMTNLALAEGTRCLFTRVVATGSESLAGALAERRGLTLEHSHQWLRHVGLSEPVDALDGDPEIVTEARSVLEEGVRRIADDIRNSLDFFRAQSGMVSVESAVLTGPGSAVPGFAERLGAEVGVPVVAGVVHEATPGALNGVDAGRLAVAAGLAVEERAA